MSDEGRSARLEELLGAIRADGARAERLSEEEMDRLRGRCHEAANLIMVLNWKRGLAGCVCEEKELASHNSP